MARRRDPDPAALCEFRARRGWTREQMADAVWATPLEVAAWEAGAVRVPPEQATRIRDMAAEEYRYGAVLAAGLPPCAWADTYAPDLLEQLARGASPEQMSWPVWAHLDECPTCGRVRSLRRTLRVRLPPGLGSDPLEHVARRLDGMPLLMGRTGLLLAVVAVVASAGLLLDALPGPRWNFWRAAALGVLGSVGAGWLLRRQPRLDPFLRGMLQSVAGGVVGVCAWMLIDPSHGAGAALLAGGSVLALGTGVLMGRLARWRSAYRAARDAADERALQALSRLGDGSPGPAGSP